MIVIIERIRSMITEPTCKAVCDAVGLATHQAPPDVAGAVVAGVGMVGVVIGVVGSVVVGGGGPGGIIIGVAVYGGVGLTMGIVSSWVSDIEGGKITGISSLSSFRICRIASRGGFSAMLESEETKKKNSE
ncbi:unnamed protein product [Camellia sinensis]